jgi:DNA repair protein RadC
MLAVKNENDFSCENPENSVVELDFSSGHRARIKKDFLQQDDETIYQEVELLEMILFLALPRKDVKPLAKKMLLKYGSVRAVMERSVKQLYEDELFSESVVFAIKLMYRFVSYSTKIKFINHNIIENWEDLINYLNFTIGSSSVEHFAMISLNNNNVAINYDILTKGTVDKLEVYPREIVSIAIQNNATKIILIHNHPSGNNEPSEEDVDFTRKIMFICESLNIKLYDHIVVTSNNYYSFRAERLIF